MTLFEINRNIEDIANGMIDLETGEVNEEFVKELEQLQMAKEEKVENIACYIKNLVAYADALKKEKQSIADRQARAEKKAERLKQYLLDALQGEKFKGIKAEISYRKSQSVELTDLEEDVIATLKATNPNYINAKYTLNKTAIKDALKSGEQIFGLALAENTSVQIK